MKRKPKPIDEEAATFVKVAAFLIAYIEKRRKALAQETKREEEEVEHTC